MKRIIPSDISTYIVLSLVFLFSGLADAQVERIQRTDETSSLQLYFSFETLPAYELNVRKRRIDLFFKDITAVDDLQLPSTDDRMIKALIRPQAGGTLFSFFFRYPPQKVTENAREVPPSLMLDVLLGNRFTSMYPDLSSRFKGLTLLDRSAIDYTNPVNISQYPDTWKSFFAQHESSVSITPETTFTLPPFPIAAAAAPQLSTEMWLPETIIESSNKKEWNLVARQLRDQLEDEKNDYYRDLLLFTYAEALVRAGEYERPHTLLQQIVHRLEENLLAELGDFLFIYLRNAHENNFPGYFELEKRINQIWKKTRLNDYFSLLLAETAMEMGDLEAARQQLNRDDIGFDQKANTIRLMRKADVLYIENKKIKSLVTYLQLKNNQAILKNYPESLAKFADLLYQFKRYEQAMRSYLLLRDSLTNTSQYDLVLFRLAMSSMHNGAIVSEVENDLRRINQAFNGTEGVFRAKMKLTDLEYLNETNTLDDIAQSYNALSIQANTINLREEALFKLALLQLLDGNAEEAVEICLRLLREFQNGLLKIETRALIIQQLPSLIRSMVDNGRYIDALVLAQKNRDLFVRGWIANSLLYDLATAYSDLGFFDRSARTYQYLFDVSNKDEQEKIYLPLIQSLYQDGQYQLLENYADRFNFRYPDSEFLPDIFLLRIKALIRTNAVDKATALLESPDSPTSKKIEELTASVFFDQERWQDVIDLLVQQQPLAGSVLPREQKKMLAESLYQNGQYQKAKPLFQQLSDEKKIDNHALFRLAQIDLKNGNREQALTRFKELAEKGKEDAWKKLAQEEIAILNLK